MPHMTFDWLTAGILRPMLARHSLGLPDLAASLHQSVGGYEPVENKALGRVLGLAEFKTAFRRPGSQLIELAMPGFNPFSSPAQRIPFPSLPQMWGALSRDVDEYRLHLSGLALHADLTALPTAGGGMLLFRAVLPDTMASSVTGRPFSDLMSHPAIDHLELIIRRLRPATADETAHMQSGSGMTTAYIGGPSAGQGVKIIPDLSVVTFRNDKTAIRVPFSI
jgi:hypothetical protein